MKVMIPSELIHAYENGTIKAIAHYQFANGKLTDYGKFEGNTGLSILGLEDNDGNYQCIGLGSFSLSNQEIENFSITGYDFYNDDIMHFFLENDKTITASMYAKSEDIPPRLYRHRLLLNNLYSLTYDSTSSNNVGNVNGLRTIMNISSANDKEILPVCTEDATSIVTLVVTTSLCKIDANDVTTVSDVVTEL